MKFGYPGIPPSVPSPAWPNSPQYQTFPNFVNRNRKSVPNIYRGTPHYSPDYFKKRHSFQEGVQYFQEKVSSITEKIPILSPLAVSWSLPGLGQILPPVLGPETQRAGLADQWESEQHWGAANTGDLWGHCRPWWGWGRHTGCWTGEPLSSSHRASPGLAPSSELRTETINLHSEN